MAFPSIDLASMGAPLAGVPNGFTMPAQAPTGMFGGNQSWRNALLAAAAGFMARRSPTVANNLINGLQDAQMLKQKLAIAQQERAQQMQDQIALHQAERDYDITHAPPPDIQDRIDVLNKIDPTLGATYARNYAQNGGGMGPVLNNPITGQTMVPAAKAPAQTPPPEAIQELRSNPHTAAQFDEIFGPGAAARVLGGAGGNASGGFPY